MFVTPAIDVSLCRVNGVLRRSGDIGDSGTSERAAGLSERVERSIHRGVTCAERFDAMCCGVMLMGCACVCASVR
jgi:hypothetical protein